MASREININVRANVVNVQAAMQQVSQSVQSATNSMKIFGGGVNGLANGPLNKFQGQIQTLPKQMNAVSTATQQSTSRLGRFGEIFRDNRGIVFGVAGLTSALAEAVGMMGMYGDSAMRLAEAQNKLNNLMAKGVTEGKAFSDAQNEVTKQQRFFNMVQRNTILSQMDMIFFTTMAVSGLVKLGTTTKVTGGFLGKLKGFFTGNKVEMGSMTGSLQNFNTVTNKATTSTNIFGKALNALKINIRGLLISTGIGAVLVAAGFLIEHFMKVSEAAKESSEKQKNAMATVKNDMEAMSAITKLSSTESLESIEGLSEGGVESLEVLAEAIRNLSVQQGISVTQSKLLNLQRLRDDTQTAAGIIKVKIFEAEADIKLQAMRTRGNLQKMRSESQTLKDLNADLKTAETAWLSYDDQIKDVEKTLAGASTGGQDFANIAKQINDNVAAGVSTTATATDTFNNMFNSWMKGGHTMRTANEIFAGVQTTLNDLVSTGQLNAVQAGQIEEMWRKALGTYEESTDSAVIATGRMGNAVNLLMDDFVTLGDEIQKTYQDQASSKFWDAFNVGSADAVALMEQAKVKVDAFFQEWAPSIKAGMDPQEKFNELLAEMPLLLQEPMRIGYNEWMEKNKEGTKDAKDEVSDHTRELEKQAEALKESIQALAGKTTMITGSTIMNEKLADAIGNTTQGIIDEADALKYNRLAWATMTESQKQSLDNANSLRLAESKIIPILDQTARGRQAVTDAVIKGNQEASDTINTALEENIVLATQRERWFDILSVMDPAIDTTGLLTSEMQGLVEHALLPAEEKLHLLKTAMAEATNASRSFWSSVIGAEDNKAFGEAFKKMDLGAIPKKLRDDVKDLFDSMRDDAEKGKEVQTAFSAIQASIGYLGDTLSKSEIREMFRKAVDVFEEGAGSANGFGQSIYTNILDPLSELNKKELYARLEELPGTMNLINTAQSDGIVTFDEYKNIMIAYAKEGGTLKNLTDQQRTALAAMGIVVDETTGKIDTSKASVAQYSEEMAKIEVNGIVVKTIGEMWADLARMIMEANIVLQENWSETVLNTLEMFVDTSVEMGKTWASFILFVDETNDAMVSGWQDNVNEMQDTLDDATDNMTKLFDNMASEATSIFDDLLGEWSDVCAEMVTAAEDAAEDIEKELASIPDEEVRINYVRTGAGQSQGGVHSFADGGMISAASGLYTTNGPANLGPFHFGDNSGGRETVAFLPHDGNKADRIMDELDTKFNRTKSMTVVSSGGDRDIIVPITININGEQYSFSRKYRIRQGQEIASQVF